MIGRALVKSIAYNNTHFKRYCTQYAFLRVLFMLDEKKYFISRLENIIGDESIRAFARRAEISDGALRQYLSGKSEPTRPALIKLANAAGVNLTWLITGAGEKEKDAIELSFIDLAAYIRLIFADNRRRRRGDVPLSTDPVFLAGVSDDHCDKLEEIAVNAFKKDNRLHVIIDATSKNIMQIAEELTGMRERTNYAAFTRIEEFIIKNDKAVIFRYISRCKYSSKPGLTRSLIKILDRSVRNPAPESDLVFIDHASFLEKAWKDIGYYVKTNIITGSAY